MSKILNLSTPLTEADVRNLHAGDIVKLNGVIYTGRDAAHKRLCAALANGEKLPVDLNGQLIYFVGPCPAPPGRPIGSAGPTTSGRMDAYSPRLIRECSLRGMIGKGKRSGEVVEAMKTHGAVYFGAIGGCGALLGKCVKKSEMVAYPDLGAEAICRWEVEDLPVIVVIDSQGNNLYETGREAYLNR